VDDGEANTNGNCWSCRWIAFFSTCVISIGLGIFALTFVPGFAKRLILAEMTLKDPHTKLYGAFRNLSSQTTLRYNFYFFNITNGAELNAGTATLPEIVEVGPYVYMEERWRPEEKMEWLPNGTIRHYVHTKFHFMRDESVGPNTDVIFGARIGLFVLLQTNAANGFGGLDWLLLYGQEFFQPHTVDEMVIGYHDPLLVELAQKMPGTVPTTLVNFLTEINDTNEQASEIYSGIAYSPTAPASSIVSYPVDTTQVLPHGPPDYRLGSITMFRGNRNASWWGDRTSQMINGTDGTIFNPYLPDVDHSKAIYVFVDTLNRSVGMLHAAGDEDTLNGITLHNYRIDLRGQLPIPENHGFAVYEKGFQPRAPIRAPGGTEIISPDGIFTAFTKDFYLDCDMSNVTVKMPRAPDRSLDDTIMSIEPHTGAAMKVFKRVQFNVRLRNVPDVPQLNRLTPTWLPVLRATEWTVVPEALQDMVKNDALLPLMLAQKGGTALIAIFGILIVLVPLVSLVKRWRRSKTQSMAADHSGRRESPAAWRHGLTSGLSALSLPSGDFAVNQRATSDLSS
jgi:hypothetical protein